MKLYEVPESMRDFQNLILKMSLFKVESLRAEFCGSGDCGEIDHVEMNPDTDEFTVPMTVKKWDIETSSYREEVEDLTFKKAFENLVYSFLEKTDVDWYNNEGGGGYFMIDLAGESPVIDYDVYYNEIQQVSAVRDSILLKEMS